AIRTLNGGGKAAEGATLSALEARGLNEIPLRGIVPATLTVPGAVASWTGPTGVFGGLPLRRVLESAIGYARDGFPVTGRLANFIEMVRDDLQRNREAAALFFPQGAAAPPGGKLTNANLARTLQSIADDGWQGFYQGPVATEMARFSEENGGLFRLADFSRQKAVWAEPLVGRYRDVTVFNTPPPTQGFTV